MSANKTSIPDGYLESFIEGFISCLLWSESERTEDGDSGDPLEDNYSADDIDPKAMEEIRLDCADFVTANIADLLATGADPETSGHDFQLTRNRHGAGFRDRGYGEAGDRLTEAAHVYGTLGAYAHDGKVYTHG